LATATDAVALDQIALRRRALKFDAGGLVARYQRIVAMFDLNDGASE
jgi:hypothetical protein